MTCEWPMSSPDSLVVCCRAEEYYLCDLVEYYIKLMRRQADSRIVHPPPTWRYVLVPVSHLEVCARVRVCFPPGGRWQWLCSPPYPCPPPTWRYMPMPMSAPIPMSTSHLEVRAHAMYCLRLHARVRVCHRQSLSLCQWWRTVWRTDWVWNPFCPSM